MRIREIDHVLLAMPPDKENEARAFYTGLLGIPEVPKPPSLAKRGGCWFVRDAVKIHLGVEVDFHPAHKAHPAFLVEDLAGLIALLGGAGYSPITDERMEGYNRIFVDDPFGNRLELMEPRHPDSGRDGRHQRRRSRRRHRAIRADHDLR